MRRSRIQRHFHQAGFSLLEMLLATVILLVGLIAVAQLVPASILLNGRSRVDSSALVYAQRELDQMLAQPILLQGNPPQFTDADGHLCNLGDPTQPNILVGSPVVFINNQVFIDFTQATQANYSFAYQDLNDPSGAMYDIRWAVITDVAGTRVTSKRFILGVRQEGGNGFFQPITLDTMVEK
jgi:prepilin-type N-terminal cleavage/methylation domain-containing protein